MAPRLRRHSHLPLMALVTATGGLLLAMAGSLAPARAAIDGPGGKGAQVYCFMRNNGNSHEVSWSAAYALIKRQSASMFKTSPEHAAVMITESVVQNPGTYPDCGRYLGDLYIRRLQMVAPVTQEPSPAPSSSATTAGPTPLGVTSSSGGMTRNERYAN